MADVITLMDIDDDNDTRRSLKSNKGKDVVVSTAPPDTKATPWVEKYRPQSLDDVAAHRDIVETIDRLASGNRLPHLLLYGPPGTGKTSTILAMARKLYGNQMHNMVLELNASDDRGIDVVRQQIQDFASTQSISFGAKSAVKLVLLDEADAMTKDAQFALRRVIEKYTKSTRFALICNNVNKVIPALQSRCTRFRFAPLDAVHVAERLKHVINAEGLDVPDNGLKALVRLSNGDMRKALNILQSTHMASQQITEEAVYLCTGNPLPREIEQIAHWLLNESFATGYKRISEIKTRKGLALVDIVREVTMIKMPADVRIQLINDMADIDAKSAVKLVLLDEADAMTKDAQFALRRVIEKYTKSTRFALICNNVNKVIPALQSRCTRFRFAPLDAVHVAERLKHVINAEGLDVPDNGLKALVRLSNGDMRKALNILQSTHMASQQITEEAVYLCTGNPLPREIEQIAHWLLNESFATGYKRISEIKTRKGLALVDIVREVTMIKMPADVRIQLINDMADIEYRLSLACNDKLQLGSLIAAFTKARVALVAAVK